MPPVSIPEGFAAIARKEPRGKGQKWQPHLVICGILDIDKTQRDHPVCTHPTSEMEWEELSDKIEWLRPYTSDSFVEDVVKQMDKVLLDSEYRPATNDPESSKDA